MVCGAVRWDAALDQDVLQGFGRRWKQSGQETVMGHSEKEQEMKDWYSLDPPLVSLEGDLVLDSPSDVADEPVKVYSSQLDF